MVEQLVVVIRSLFIFLVAAFIVVVLMELLEDERACRRNEVKRIPPLWRFRA